MWLDNLKNMKEQSRMTTREISAKSGIPEPTLEKLFAGATKDPKLATMQQLVHFLGYTLDDLDDLPKREKKAPPYSSEAMRLASDYDELDRHGKNAVRAVADVEKARCTEQAQAAPEVERLVYVNPAAAGSPLYAESDFERLTFPEGDVPPGADFGIRISGRSMEPTVPDGCIAWVHKTVDLDDGKIGIFMLNDSAVCKRCFRSGGIFRLESDNPDYGPVEIHETDNIVLVGEVIGTT